MQPAARRPTSTQSQTAGTARQQPSAYGPPTRLGVLEDPAITESSGLAASRAHPGIFWTHNDSGDGPFIYAFDRKGKRHGVWRVAGAQARDWEDMALGPGRQPGSFDLYIGDIGDNNAGRAEIVVYRVAEPNISLESPNSTVSTKKQPRLTKSAQAIRLQYPDGAHDAETLLVHPLTGDLYIVTKTFSTRAGVYKAAAPFDTAGVRLLARIADVRLPNTIGNLITGGSISPDGKRVVLCDYLRAYEMQTSASQAGKVATSRRGSPQSLVRNAFDSVWHAPLAQIDIGARNQGEAICYRHDGEALLTTSEGQWSAFTEVVRERSRRK